LKKDKAKSIIVKSYTLSLPKFNLLIMKKLLFAVVAMAAFLLTSCSKSLESKLEGTWRIVSLKSESGENLTEKCTTKNTLTFNDDETYKAISYDEANNGDCIQDDVVTGVWSLSEDDEKLTLNEDGAEGDIETASIDLDDDVLTLKVSVGKDGFIMVLEKQ
jgi:hypothetical protein